MPTISNLHSNYGSIAADILRQYEEAMLGASRAQELAYSLDKEKSRVQNLADLEEFIEKGTCKMWMYVDQTKKFLLRREDTYYCSIQEGLLKVRKELSDDHKQLFARLADREGFKMTFVESFRAVKPERVLYWDWKREVDDSELFTITDEAPKKQGLRFSRHTWTTDAHPYGAGVTINIPQVDGYSTVMTEEVPF